MKVFGYCPEGFKQAVLSHNISIEGLVSLITENPEEGLIKLLRESPYRSGTYSRIKSMLPYVTPHATFRTSRKKENVDRLSGYFYLDVDAAELPDGPEPMREHILKEHSDKVALLGTSVGGQGLFFYVRLANPQILTPENFDAIYDFVRRILFSDIPTDGNAGGVNRTHIIPWDSELYVNLSATITVPDSVHSSEKVISRCINTNTVCCIGGDKFLPIGEVLKLIKTTTEVDVGDLDVLVKEVLCCQVFTPRVIKDGRKHTVYRAMVNCIMHNNPGIELLVILSFINYVNTYHTDGKPMILWEMKRTVTAEYNRIQKGGEIKGLKPKFYHSNPKHDRITRIRNVARLLGAEKKQRSIGLIRKAVEQLKQESADKPTIKKVAKLLDGQLSEGTINRYWRSVVPKRIVD